MIKSTTLALCAIALTGCHTTGHENRVEAYQKIVTGENGNKFEPRGIKNTSSKDLARLIAATDRAYAVLGFENPKPLIRIVDRTSPALPRGVIAAATVDEQGKEYLYFERQHLSKALSIEGLVFHEASHLYAWRVYGTKIPGHGVQFMGICLQGARRSECEAE
jgi:hypothetical protein